MQRPADTSFELRLPFPSWLKAKTPEGPGGDVRRRLWLQLPCGFIVLFLCLLAGEQIKNWLHQPIPGNVLGLFILLICFRLHLISPRLIEEASNRLLFILPALFIPIYVSAIGQEQLWSRVGAALLLALLAATVCLWIFVGHLAQLLFRDSKRHE